MHKGKLIWTLSLIKSPRPWPLSIQTASVEARKTFTTHCGQGDSHNCPTDTRPIPPPLLHPPVNLVGRIFSSPRDKQGQQPPSQMNSLKQMCKIGNNLKKKKLGEIFVFFDCFQKDKIEFGCRKEAEKHEQFVTVKVSWRQNKFCHIAGQVLTSTKAYSLHPCHRDV